MTAETLHLNYIRDLLGVDVADTTASDFNIVAAPGLVHVITPKAIPRGERWR